jgi:hypothetical protein
MNHVYLTTQYMHTDSFKLCVGPNGYSCVVEDVKMHCSFLGEKCLPILLCNVYLDNFINFSFASLAEKSRVTWICLATGDPFYVYQRIVH